MPPNEVAVLVVAFGNRWGGDDAFGGLVSDALRPFARPRLQVLDLTADGPTALLSHLEGQAGLIVIDAILAGGNEVGELIDLDWRETAGLVIAHERSCSTHGLSVDRQLELAAGLGILPQRVRLIGASIQTAAVGAEVSADIQQAVPRAVERVIWWVKRWCEGEAGANVGA